MHGDVIKTGHETHLLRLACALSDPWLRLVPGLVQGEQSGLAATLDELIRLCDELAVEDPARQLGVRRDRVGRRVPGDLRDLDRGVLELGLDLGVGRDGGRALEPVGQEQLGVVLADGCIRRDQKSAGMGEAGKNKPLDDMVVG